MSGHIGDMVSQHYNTPDNILASVRKVLGGEIDLDPCDNEWSTTRARVSYKLPANNGLRDSWLIAPDGTPIKSVFCNPPYGTCYLYEDRDVITRDEYKALEAKELDHKVVINSLEDWVERCARYGIDVPVFLLIPSSTETAFWDRYIWNPDYENYLRQDGKRMGWEAADAICFIRGRIKHPLMGKETAPSTKGSALIFWGSVTMAGRFKEVFEYEDKHGRVVLL